jgi:acetamidase/formamidase
VSAGEIDPYLVDFWKSLPGRTKYDGPHILTGPVYVDGAQPGDTLEIQILDLKTRVPFGVNSTGPRSGVFADFYPGFRPGDDWVPTIPATIPSTAPAGVLPNERQHLIRTGTKHGEDVAFFSEDIDVPLQEFMGVMALASADGAFVGNTPDAPPPAFGVQSSTPPGPFGGNLDVRDFAAGSSLYLPVEQVGALFYTGDPHAVQGNGEVSGTALEQSLTGTFRFVLHKGDKPTSPFGEDAENYIVTGIDHDLDRAMVKATAEMVRFLVDEKGLTEAKAYSLASLAGDFQVGEVVDRTQVITGKIPKSLFD